MGSAKQSRKCAWFIYNFPQKAKKQLKNNGKIGGGMTTFGRVHMVLRVVHLRNITICLLRFAPCTPLPESCAISPS